MTSYQPPKVPLEYEGAEATRVSGWRAVGYVAGGFVAGGVAGVLVLMAIGGMFPTQSRAEAGQQANVLVYCGLGIGVAGIVALVFRRWFWGGLLGGCGFVCTGFGFVIGLMSSITC